MKESENKKKKNILKHKKKLEVHKIPSVKPSVITRIFSIIIKLNQWEQDKRNIVYRLVIVACFFSIAYLGISFRLMNLTSNTQGAQNRNIKSFQVFFRNEIVDRNNELLVANIPSTSLFVNPQKVINQQKTIQKITSSITSIKKNDLVKALESSKTFAWVKRDLTPAEQTQIIELGLPGFYFENEVRRVYTHGSMLSHVLGYVGRDNNGLAGIERYFNDYLSSPKNKEPLKLSLDLRVQNIVSEELDATIQKFKAKGAVGIVADVTNGELIAVVSKPDFDPHNPSISSAEQLFNNATHSAIEIGSVAKTITFAIGLDNKTISLNDVYNIGNLTVSNFKVKDYHQHNGWNTVPQLFMNSSNIGASMIALEIGKRKFKEYLDKLGLTKQLEIELAERAYPILPNFSKLSDLSLSTMSYGYGMSISPMHYVQAMIPIVNGGYKYPLTLVKRKGDIKGEKILDEETSESMVKLMRLTVEKGTGKKAAVNGYLVGGKTGTANKLGRGGYLENSRISSFVAITPSISPKYIIFILLDDPQGIKETFGFATAGFTAAPAAGNIIARMASIYSLKPYDENDENIKKMLHVDYEIENEI